MSDPPTDNDTVERTVQRMAELHAEHDRRQSPFQRRISHVTGALSRPQAVAVAAALVLLWMAANTLAALAGFKAWDAAPFALLELVATVLALLTTLVIMASQAREEEAARHRAQLTLQLASLSEQKIAKVIALLEEQRRDSSVLPNRADPHAAELSKPIDPKQVMARVRDTHEGAATPSPPPR